MGWGWPWYYKALWEMPMCSKDGKSLPMNLGQLKTHGAGSMHLGNIMDEHSKVPPLKLGIPRLEPVVLTR